ncbi:MAG TPA: TonB C-terminal domain-containing protein, partial [Polyangiaceae bacterium]|nr:TonB C-terminal domain-containing protein [Polyangiaceae bacterium]
PEKPKVVEKEPEPKKEEAKPPDELPKIRTPNRIAVQQHVEDKQQEDNPNAEFIADEANKVAEQTRASVTSTDQNEKEPTPAGNHSSADKTPGNSDESHVAQSEDRPGEPDRAPNDGEQRGEKLAARAESSSGAASVAASQANPGVREAAGNAGKPAPAKAEQLAEAEQRAQAGLRPLESAPETLSAQNGAFSAPRAQPQMSGRTAQPTKKKRLPPTKPNSSPLNLLGLGAPGTTAGGVNLNLTPRMAYAAVGQDRLTKERQADAERRKSAHRGSWRTMGIERWRSAIENYVASVKPGNQTALNTARVPFAGYLNQIHNRLHPIFADSFLASLDRLPGSHPLNRPDMSTNLEIVLDREEGKIVRMGITKTSGVTAFDIAALESVQRAQPFGTPPQAIISPDGNVYFHWEFYRDPFYACSTYFARPYMLKVKPKTAPPELPAPKPRPYDPSEPPQSDERHGSLDSREPAPEKRAALR